jgi:hypothetical protein
MAGRCISVTHDALGAVRVMRTCGCQGEIIGMAASLCARHQTDPRGVYQRYLTDLHDIMHEGTGLRPATDSTGPGASKPPVRATPPAWLGQAGENFARRATISAPGSKEDTVKTHLLLNDGNGKVDDNSARWICREPAPHAIEFHWKWPIKLGAARIISGYHTGGRVIAPVEDFTLQWHDGKQWKNAVDIAGNSDIAWAATFPEVRTDRIRLLVTKTKDNISRIWEVELYPPIRKSR